MARLCRAVIAAALISLSPALVVAQDADSDGVPDARDICPSTRGGRTVDSAGCDAFCEVVYDATSTSAFLRSRLLEVGAASWGSFGTTAGPPAGWHARPLTNLGFVANPADDDWAVYQGDFFVPGTPEEGFGVNVGGVDYYTSQLMLEQGVVGDFTGVRVECRPRICGLRGGGSVYWAGTRDGIGIAQTYSVFNEGLFILIEVALTNTTATEQTVYYMRNVDPDNMQTVTGDFVTTNTIVSQGDGTATSLALVSATTTGPDSYIALASSDPDARVTHGGFSNRDVDGVWSCTGAGLVCTTGTVVTSDIAISLAVRKIIPPGDTRSFSYVYTLSAAAIAESVACTVPSICGDGVIEGTESCDDANTTAGDGCDPTCGIEPGWDCLGAPSVCDEICGDSLVVGAEPCDDGGESAACNADCTPATCGDSTVNATAGEACDDGNTEPGDGCSASCTMESCGDGAIDPGEECDDGGVSAACDADCTTAMCGDGIVNMIAGESCDDGNALGGDGCSASCANEACGNGVIDDGEACDDAGVSPTCDADCTAAMCGDGVVNLMAGENCDDGARDPGDGCSPECENETDGGPIEPDAGPRRFGVSGGGACAAAPGNPAGAWLLMMLAAALWIVRRRRA